MRRGLIIIATFLAMAATNAMADINWDLVDDPPIFVGSPGCPAPPGCPVYGNEVNGITGNTFTLTQWGSNAAYGPSNPLLLIVGILNNTASPSPTITLSNGTGALGGPVPNWVAGHPWDSNGYVGQMTANGPITDAYQAINQGDPWNSAATAGNSDNFTNWSAADAAALGLNAASFGIYVYDLSNTGLSGKGTSVNVTFGSALPTGSFVVAYGCTTTVNSPPCTGKNVFSTPFTQAGLEMGGNVSMPEASSAVILSVDLLGLGLFAVGYKGWKKWKRPGARSWLS